MDQLKREARKGRKWSFVGKGKDGRQRKRNWGASRMSSAPPDPAGRPSSFPRGHLPSQTGRGPGRCPSGDMSLPPNVEPGGPRSRGERTHFPIPGRTQLLGSPAARGILTWETSPTAALAVRTTRLAALTRAPPRPGAGPQLSPVDLSFSSRELASPPPGARSRCQRGNPSLS